MTFFGGSIVGLLRLTILSFIDKSQIPWMIIIITYTHSFGQEGVCYVQGLGFQGMRELVMYGVYIFCTQVILLCVQLGLFLVPERACNVQGLSFLPSSDPVMCPAALSFLIFKGVKPALKLFPLVIITAHAASTYSNSLTFISLI